MCPQPTDPDRTGRHPGSASERTDWGPHTRTVHPPHVDGLGAGLTPAIIQSSTFRLDSVEQGADFTDATHPDRFYTRWGNPTTRVFERAVAELEGAEEALATGSGMGAISAAIMTLVKGGDHVVAGNTLYTATNELFSRFLPEYGVTATYVDASDPANFAAAIRPNTTLIYVETPANPTLGITDLAAVGAIAAEHGIAWLVDNTFATPYNQNPIAHGATASLHSATKYLNGHTDVTAGVVAGSDEFIRRVWYTIKLLGPTLSPFDSWLAIRGLRTFAMRMERHNRNALELARHFETHDAIDRVFYPGLPAHAGHDVAARIMPGGFGGMLSLEVRGGYEAGKRFVENVRIAELAVSLGGVETLVEHPASMTHGPLTDEDRERAGVSEGLVRVSVGVEDIEDLKHDFDRALDCATQA